MLLWRNVFYVELIVEDDCRNAKVTRVLRASRANLDCCAGLCVAARQCARYCPVCHSVIKSSLWQL